MDRNPRGMKTMAAAWVVVLLLAALPALAQTALTPPGTGTAADPYRLTALGHLVWMGENAGSSAGKYYLLLNDIDAAATSSWNDEGTGADILEGFRPIGTMEVPFTGDFDGRKHAIRGLTINRPETDGVGFFGGTGYYGVVHHLGLEGGSVTGKSTVGGLVGGNTDSTVTKCYSSGLVAGQDYVGGLVGVNLSSRVRQCHTTGAVAGRDYVGGLVGASFAATQIEECYTTGTVTGSNRVGGLVGATDSPGEVVMQCYARGAVAGDSLVGGLVGWGGAKQSYATGAVAGDSLVGGLVGSGAAEQCYAMGAATGRTAVGGLVGWGDARQCYATGAVAGMTNVGGLIGQGTAPAEECYWDTETSGQTTSAGGEGRTTAEMREHGTYVGWSWSFPSPWRRAADLNDGYPYMGVGMCLLRFLAGPNGAVTGETTQWVTVGLDATPVEAVPAYGFVFEQWSDWETENPRTLTAVDADAELTASFRPAGPASCLLRFLAGPNGVVTGETTQWVAFGQDATPVTARPSFGFVFEQWSDGLTENPRTLTAVEADADLAASFRPAGPAASPSGVFMAVVGAAEAGQGRGLWGLTGTYLTSVAGYPLTLNLVHDSRGRLTGTGALQVAAAGGKVATPVNLRAMGSVKGSGRALTLKLRMQGANSAKTVRMDLSFGLALDAEARHLGGPVRGSVRTTAGTTTVADTVALDLPAAMDGTWKLLFSLITQGRLSAGTAVLTLSNGVEHRLAASGRSSGQTLVLSLTGAATDPAASGIRLKTTITPLEGGWARFEVLSGSGYGQAVR